MKSKNYLVAFITINAVRIKLACRKLANGKYRWYGNDGTGVIKLDAEDTFTLQEAKLVIRIYYPPDLYDMVTTWIL